MEKIVYEDGSEELNTIYTDLFYSDFALRPCCGECRYASYKRIADFTVGDFLGVENYNPEFYDDAGISLLFLNNARADQIFDKIKNDFEYIEADIQKCQQHNMIKPTIIPANREDFWKTLKNKGIVSAINNFTIHGGIKFRIRRKILTKLGKWK